MYIITNNNYYAKYKIYLTNLINNYYFIKLKIFFYYDEIINFINKQNNIKYIFTDINDYINIKRSLNFVESIYLLVLSNNFEIINLTNTNFKYITPNSIFYENNKNKSLYIPYQFSIKDNIKEYDISILESQYTNFINNQITILNEYSIKVVSKITKYENINYKIFIYIPDNNNIDEYLLTYLIYNKILIIYLNNEKNLLSNFYLKDYIIFINNNNTNDNNDKIKKIVDNYGYYYNKLYCRFNKSNFHYFIKNCIKSILPEYNYEMTGFIIIRNVVSEKTNMYWKESYNSIREKYDNTIIIIDDNSNPEYLIKEEEENLINCYIIRSEFNGAGEILGYYYYYKYNFFKRAIIIHDSVFINKKIDNIINSQDDIKFLWHFAHNWDSPDEEINLINEIFGNNNDIKNKLISFYNEKSWLGCFGIQSLISYNFLKYIFNKYNLTTLPTIVNTRVKRMNLERIFALICSYEERELIITPSYYGIIHHYIHWGYSFDSYLKDKLEHNLDKYQLIKVWSGR